MRLARLFLLVIGLGWISAQEGFSQQIPQFSQYMFNPTFINPAYAGYKQELYLQTYYRKQWTGVEGSPETFALAGDATIFKTRLGVGGQIMTDKIGAQRTTAAYGNLSYHLQLTDSRFLSFGMGAGLIHSSLDGGMLNPANPSDPAVPAGSEQTFYTDVKAGLFLYDDLFFIGIAGDQLLSPVFDFDRGDVKIQPVPHVYLSGGVLVDLSDQLSLLPSFMYMDDFKSPSRMDLNALFILNDNIWMGGGYRMGLKIPGREIQKELRMSSAIIGMFQIFLGEGFRFGYGYDHSISGFGPQNTSSHEISLAYWFRPRKLRIISPRYF